MTARKAEGVPITMACRVAAVSRQAYIDWRARQAARATDAKVDEAHLVNAMVDIAGDFDQTYGSPRMTAELANRGWSANHKRVERLMAENQIVGVHKPAKIRTTIPAEAAPPAAGPDRPGLRSRRFRLVHDVGV